MSVPIKKWEPKGAPEEPKPAPEVEPEPEPEETQLAPLESFRVDHSETVGLSWEQIEALRPPIIIEGFLRQGEVMLLGAESKSRKSWLAQDAGISVASGLPWLPGEDGEGGFQTVQGAVHVFDLELADSEVKYRFAKARGNRLPGDLEAQRELSERFHSYSLEGEPALAILAHLEDLADTVDPGDLVILDCLYRLQADGNETEEVARIFENLKRFAKRTQAGVVLVDHFRKAGADKARDRFAGSFVKAASASTLVAIEAKADDVLELNIDARTFHGMNRVHARFNPTSYVFERVTDEDVQAAKDAKEQAKLEGWIGNVWGSRSIDFEAGKKVAGDSWSLCPEGARQRFSKIEKAGLVQVQQSGPGKATLWGLTPEGRKVIARNYNLHPSLHPSP
jgi:hypothetical protein